MASNWGKNYPLFLCLLITNILFGLGAMIVGALLLDWARFPESTVHFFNWLKHEQSQESADSEDIDEMMENEKQLHMLLFILGVLSIIFGILTTYIGLDIMYMLCIRENRSRSSYTGAYGAEMESEMSKVVGTKKVHEGDSDTDQL